MIRNFYTCINKTILKKKNGDKYLLLKLINQDEMIDGYLWGNISFFENKIKNGETLAIKGVIDNYLDETVINIKNISIATEKRYDKYGFSKKSMKIDISKSNEIYINEIIKITSTYRNKSINEILNYISGNKILFKSKFSFYYKILSIKHLLLLKSMSFKDIKFYLCIIVILIDRINLDKNDFLTFLSKRLYKKDYLVIESYLLNKKEFIKKYKFIVDLIDYNFKNQDYLVLEDIK